MGGGEFPPCGCLAWGNPALEPRGSLLGLMVDSMRAHAKEYFPELLLPVSFSPWWCTATPSASAGDPPSLACRSGSVSYGITAPSPWVLMHTLLCVCPPRVESMFPPGLLKSCNQIKFCLQSLIIWEFLLPLPAGWEGWCGAQNLHSSGWTSVV